MFQAEKTHRFLSFWPFTELSVLKEGGEHAVKTHTTENQDVWVLGQLWHMRCPVPKRQDPWSIWIKYFYLSNRNISTCAVFAVKNKWHTVKKATLQSTNHLQMEEMSITVSAALCSLKWSLHSQVLTAVYMEGGGLVFGCLEDLFYLMPALPLPPFFFLWTFKSMIKDAKQRAKFTVSVNQQNSRIHTAKSIQPSSSWQPYNTTQVFNWEFSEQGWW